MKLASNWKELLRHAWSVRLIVAAAILSGLEALLPLLEALSPPDWISVALTVATPAVVAAAFIARLVAQKDLPNG